MTPFCNLGLLIERSTVVLATRQKLFKLNCDYKSLANAKRPFGYNVLCLRLKSWLCSCPHYGRIVLFTNEFYPLAERVVISMHVDVTTG